ncbi:MAG: SdiA-regulated domain-containing protein [Bacteroidota bacterium]
MPFAQSVFTYDLHTPDESMILPDYLKEISGISLSADHQSLWAVQDEWGIIYQVDLMSHEVRDSISFWKDGDYEDIEVVGNTCFVLKSTGTVYRFLPEADTLIVEKQKGGLSKEDDAEGLCYDAKQDRLLITCKNGDSRQRTIHSFDMKEHSFAPASPMAITREALVAFLDEHPELENRDKLYNNFEAEKFKFAPSAIAIHPITDHFYVLSSKGKTLLILDRSGQIIHIQKLKKQIHAQPEGICFDASGRLYISNEGIKKEAAKIYRFDPLSTTK